MEKKPIFRESCCCLSKKIEESGADRLSPSLLWKNATLPQNSINSRPFPKYSHLFVPPEDDAGMRVLAERERNADIYFPIPSQFYFSEKNASFSFRMLGKGGLWVGGCGVSNHSQEILTNVTAKIELGGGREKKERGESTPFFFLPPPYPPEKPTL